MRFIFWALLILTALAQPSCSWFCNSGEGNGQPYTGNSCNFGASAPKSTPNDSTPLLSAGVFSFYDLQSVSHLAFIIDEPTQELVQDIDICAQLEAPTDIERFTFNAGQSLTYDTQTFLADREINTTTKPWIQNVVDHIANGGTSYVIDAAVFRNADGTYTAYCDEP